MGTLNAFYVRTRGDLTETMAAIQKRFPSARIELGEVFVGVLYDAFEPPVDDLAALSADLSTDVLWLSFQSVVDAFEFYHWRAGSVSRLLVFGCYGDERTRDQVAGESEPWERTAFLDPQVLRLQLAYTKTNRKKRELERIWREAELLPGRTDPSINARESARKVAEHYQLPGWS